MAKRKERSPAFQFYPRQFAGDEHVTAMDLDVVGAHIILMCATAASPEGYRMPTDERAIRVRLRNPSEADWQRIKVQLLAGAWKVSEDGAWWEQHGLQRTFEKQRAFSEAQRERVSARYKDKTTEGLPKSYPVATGELPETYSSSASSSSSANQEALSEVKAPSDVAVDVDAVTDEIVDTIRKLHPRGMEDKADAMKAIHKAILKEAKAHGGKVKAARYLYQRTSTFATLTKGAKKKFIKSTQKWFNAGAYDNPDESFREVGRDNVPNMQPVSVARPVVDAAAMRAMRAEQ
jgi:hypothetical protein